MDARCYSVLRIPLQPLSDDSLTDRAAGRIRDAIHEGRYPPVIPMSEPLVVITDSDLPGDEPERILGAAGLRVRRASCRTSGEVAEAARDATALLVQWAPITAPVLDRLDRLRFVSRLGIGHDMIDLAAATARGVAVANTPDYCVEEVAAHTIAMVMALARRLPVLDRAVRGGRWSATGGGVGALRPSRATVAVIGVGRIGSLAAAHVAATSSGPGGAVAIKPVR